jgi:hypothetical protein
VTFHRPASELDRIFGLVDQRGVVRQNCFYAPPRQMQGSE